MRHPDIPEGWEFWTSEDDREDAWRLAVEYKQMQERARGDLFIRVKVIKPLGVSGYWILRREELRQETAA